MNWIGGSLIARAVADRARLGTYIGLGVCSVWAIISIFLMRSPFALIIGIVLILLGVAAARMPLGQLKKEVKALLVRPVMEEIGHLYEEKPSHSELIQQARSARLLPNWDRSSFEDRIVGTRDGVDFEFCEAVLKERRTSTDSNGNTRTRWVTVFKGMVLKFEFPKEFLGQTLVARDSGFFNWAVGHSGMDRARLEDPIFEKTFEVFTTDQVEARFLLTPDLMQRLVELEQAFHGGKLRCAFEGGEITICIEGANLFEPGSLFKPLNNPARIADLLNDLDSIYNVIEVVRGNRERLGK